MLASCAKNMLLLDIGMTLAFPTVVIAALLGSKDHPREADEYGLTFDEWQASWFGQWDSGALLGASSRARFPALSLPSSSQGA